MPSLKVCATVPNVPYTQSYSAAARSEGSMGSYISISVLTYKTRVPLRKKSTNRYYFLAVT